MPARSRSGGRPPFPFLSRPLAAVAAALALGSCASLGDSAFLVSKVSDADKSAAVTESGIAAYNERILGEADIGAIGEVARYFDVALRYNPSNSKAIRYKTMVSDFRAARLKAAVNAARTLERKGKRSESEDLALVSAVRRAESIDPGDEDVRELLKETAKVREELVSSYLARAGKQKADADAAQRRDAREKALLESFRAAGVALEVEPSEVAAVQLQRELRSEVSAIVQRRIDGMEALFARREFMDARAQLGVLKELNARLGGAFDRKIADAEYGMYLEWAEFHYGERELALAEGKVDVALGLRKGADAAALKRRIAADRAKAEQGADFQSGLANIDAYLAKGEIDRAYRVVAALTKSAATPGERAAVNQRRDRVVASVGGVYERGVALYREERFRESIAKLELVVSIDPGYGDAMDYLAKAREKQKLLEQFE